MRRALLTLALLGLAIGGFAQDIGRGGGIDYSRLFDTPSPIQGYKDLTSGAAAVNIVRIDIPAGSFGTYYLQVMTVTSDGTDHRIKTETIYLSCYAKATAEACNIAADTGEVTSAGSAGTLTVTLAQDNSGTNIAYITITATVGTITPTTLRAYWKMRAIIQPTGGQTISGQ